MLLRVLPRRAATAGLLVDALYFALSDDGRSSTTGQGPVGATLTATADVEVKQAMLAVAALYRIA